MLCFCFIMFTQLFGDTGIKMGAIEIVDLSSDDEGENFGPEVVSNTKQHETNEGLLTKYQRSQSNSTRQDSEENISVSGLSTCHSYSGVPEQGLLPVEDTGLSCLQSTCAAPICRKFWKAGSYDNGLGSKSSTQRNPILIFSN